MSACFYAVLAEKQSLADGKSMIKGRDNVLPRMDCTAMEFHSYLTSLEPFWNSTVGSETYLGCPACCPVMRHKTGFLLNAAWGCGKPQPWRPWTAMENHSYEGSIDQLWNSTAMVGGHSYGIPEQVQTDSGVECIHRFPARGRIQSGTGTCALFAQFLYDRSFPSPALACAWQSFSARLTIFSLEAARQVLGAIFLRTQLP
jgi:hypothetical protein